MRGIRGLHVNWTLPRRLKRGSNGQYVLKPDEIVTSIHSARAWNEFSGPIDMVTDDEGAAWLEASGLADLYRTIDVECLRSIDPDVIDPQVYPTLGKVLALESAVCPVAVLDTDFYFLRPADNLADAEFVFSHFETVDNFVYPPAAVVPDVNGVIDHAWDFRLRAANTSFAFFSCDHHRESLVEKAVAYARHNNRPSSLYAWVRPCFAEQRISVFEAERLGISYQPLIEAIWSPRHRRWDGQVDTGLYHHTWYVSDRIFSDPSFARHLVEAQISHLLRRFPHERNRILKLKELRLLDVSDETPTAHGS